MKKHNLISRFFRFSIKALLCFVVIFFLVAGSEIRVNYSYNVGKAKTTFIEHVKKYVGVVKDISGLVM